MIDNAEFQGADAVPQQASEAVAPGTGAPDAAWPAGARPPSRRNAWSPWAASTPRVRYGPRCYSAIGLPARDRRPGGLDRDAGQGARPGRPRVGKHGARRRPRDAVHRFRGAPALPRQRHRAAPRPARSRGGGARSPAGQSRSSRACRSPRLVGEARLPVQTAHGTQVRGAVEQIVRRADTVFVANRHARHGADAAHLGGAPGFIEMAGPTILRIPDHRGNGPSCAPDNVRHDGRAGICIPDIEY